MTDIIYLFLPMAPYVFATLCSTVLLLCRANTGVKTCMIIGVGVSAWAYFILALAFTFKTSNLPLSKSLWFTFLLTALLTIIYSGHKANFVK